MCRKSQLLLFPLTKIFVGAFENSLCPVGGVLTNQSSQGQMPGGGRLPEGMLKLRIDWYIIATHNSLTDAKCPRDEYSNDVPML